MQELSWFRWINGAKELSGEQKLKNECGGSEICGQRPESFIGDAQDQTDAM